MGFAMFVGRATDSLQLSWVKDRSFVAHGGDLTWCLAPKMRNVTALDAGRSWSGATQNIGVIFSEAMSGDATGWSATVKPLSTGIEAAVGISYVSGSGTQAWVMQLATTLHHGDTFKISYDTATGATLSTSGSVEMNGVNTVQQPDGLSKRIRFILCDSTSTPTTPVPVVSESVKAAILEYDGGKFHAHHFLFD